MYDDEELEEIQNEFKRKELLTHALGPSISLVLHVALFLGLFFIVKAKFESEEPDIVVETVVQPTEEVIETPDDLDEITEVELESSETAENDAPAEESPDDVNTDVSQETLDVPDTELQSFNVENTSPYQTRTLEGKAIQVAKGGGDKRALSTVLGALKWLRANQNPDGSWGQNHKNAITGLATLLFLAHGETPASKHFGKTVQKSLKWLTNSINNNGNHAGNKDKHEYGYPIMVYAVAEGYSLTSIHELKEAMEKGLNRILNGYQNNGGFMYNFKKNGTYDLSFSGWSFQAMKASYLAGSTNPKLKKAIGEIPDKMIKAVGYKMDGSRVVNAFSYNGSHKGHNGGKTVYEKSAGMRSVGVLTLQLYGKKDEAQAGANLIAKHDIKSLNWDTEMGWPLYAWYYTTQVLYNNKSRSSGPWLKWNDRFQKMLYKNQKSDGHWDVAATSEKRNHGMTDIDRKVYSTSLAGLMLTVYYRYLPTTKLEPPKKAKKPTAQSQEIELDFL